MEVKRCSRCTLSKPLSNFHAKVRSPDGLSPWCRPCHAEYNVLWYRKNKAKKAALQREWAAANRDTINTRKRACYARNPSLHNARRKRCEVRLKQEIVAAYGGKCECPGCGEHRWQFMTIHHRYNDGAAERKLFRVQGKVGGGGPFYRHLRKLGYPRDRYGLLCMNCNTATAFYGRCPHQDEANDKDISDRP